MAAKKKDIKKGATAGKITKDTPIKTDLTYEQAMKKALSTPIKKKKKKAN
jgi:hypothetical protein